MQDQRLCQTAQACSRAVSIHVDRIDRPFLTVWCTVKRSERDVRGTTRGYGASDPGNRTEPILDLAFHVGRHDERKESHHCRRGLLFRRWEGRSMNMAGNAAVAGIFVFAVLQV